MSKCVVLYHKGCRDGFCAAWVAHKKLRDRAQYIPVQYGEPPPEALSADNLRDCHVIIVDFSYNRELLQAVYDQAASLVVLDHHKTAMDELKGLHFATFDMDRSGAMMCWDHFNPGQEPPWLVKYVQDRDLWTWKLPDSKLINAYISTLPYSFEAWDEAATAAGLEDIKTIGKAILSRTQAYVDVIKKNAIRWTFCGYDIPLVNAPQMDISELVGALAEGEPFAMGWWQRSDGRFSYSLRSRGDNPVDVSKLAKLMGGGGHPTAAGFETGKPLHLFPWDMCTGCGNEIDPTTCGCGAGMQAHTNPMEDGHPFVPLGCDCLRST